jgi:hypothetical protein
MINLKFQFKPFITMAVQHEYYPMGENNEMYFLPTPRTASSLDKMAMMVRQENGVLKVLFDVSKSDLLTQRIMQSSDKELKLSFMLFSKNPYFVNFTDIPVDLQGKTFYMSNKHLNAKEKGLLHETDFVTKEHLISINPPGLRYGEPEDNTFSYSIDSGNEKKISNIQQGYQIDLSHLIDGHYQIFANDKDYASFVNLGAKTKRTPLGYIDLFLSGTIKSVILNALKKDEIPSMDYQIRFNSRSIFWRFNIVPLHTKRLKSLRLNCQKGKPKMTFKDLGEFDYNDLRMHSFITEKPVKFRKEFDYEIQLKKQEGDTGGKVLAKNLAYAPVDIIKPINETDYMSEIYVYI